MHNLAKGHSVSPDRLSSLLRPAGDNNAFEVEASSGELSVEWEHQVLEEPRHMLVASSRGLGEGWGRDALKGLESTLGIDLTLMTRRAPTDKCHHQM